MTDHDKLVEALRVRFGGPGWAFFKTVANRVGGPSNYADAVAMSLYRSRGIDIHGFECKTDANDLRNELKKPKKADAVGRYTDFWHLAVDDVALLPDRVVAQLPPAWGLLVVRGGKCHQVRKATRLEPEPLDKPFLAALLVRAQEALADSDIMEARNAGFESGRRSAVREAESRQGRDAHMLGELRASVEAFEAKSGVRIGSWPYEAGRIGEAVNFVLHQNPVKQAAWLRGLMQREIENIDRALVELGAVDSARDTSIEPK